jgi:hypothetical protein
VFLEDKTYENLTGALRNFRLSQVHA